MSATVAAIQKKFNRSGTTTLKISNTEMEDIMKIAKSLEELGLLLKRITETIKNKTNKKENLLQCY